MTEPEPKMTDDEAFKLMDVCRGELGLSREQYKKIYRVVAELLNERGPAKSEET